jgi:cytochrome d ubiquinol oxidase subunit II
VASGLLAGVVALSGIAVLHADAPELFQGLTHRALPLVIASAVAGLAGLGLLVRRRFVIARAAAALAVAAILWAWGAAQYPALLVGGTTVTAAAANSSVLWAIMVALGVGALVLVPSLWLLYATFQRETADQSSH